MSLSSQILPGCPNAVLLGDVKRRFDSLAQRDYVGQQQAWHYVSGVLDSYTGTAPRATCSDWTLHLSGPSGSGKSFLAEVIANSAFEPWAIEHYDAAQYGSSATGAAVGAAAGVWFGGPLGATVGAAVGGLTGRAAYSVTQSLGIGFRAPRPFPSQCGVRQHKFSRGTRVAEVRQWEYQIAAELQTDPTAIIVVDDVGRLHDAEAFEHFGRLLCGMGGNSIPEFRTGPGDDAALVPAGDALFILTSDLEIDPNEESVSCEADSWEVMVDLVRHPHPTVHRSRYATRASGRHAA